MTVTAEQLRTDKQALLQELTTYGARILNGGSINCPFHDDKNPSGGVYQGEDGAWRFKCHGCGFCGDIFDVRARGQNRNVTEVLKETREDRGRQQKPKLFSRFDDIIAILPGQLEAAYHYTDPATYCTELSVIRYREPNGKKKFWQVSPTAGGFEIKAPPKPWPLYNRARIQSAPWVFVVEGEKCVHALHDYGYIATTSPGGSGGARYANWEPLRGKKVVLWPDNDTNGKQYMSEVREILHGLDCEIYEVKPEKYHLKEKEDAADFIAAFERDGRDAVLYMLNTVVSEARRYGGVSVDVEDMIEDTISGKRASLKWPWPILSGLTHALLPGTVTLICGDPGCAKSFALLQALKFWADEGYLVAGYELEEDRKYHLLRSLAQQGENSEVLDTEWVASNPEETRQMLARFRESLDRLGDRIWEAPEKMVDLDHLTTWVDQRAKEGCRIIAIDPVTAADSGDKPWVADKNFMMNVKTICRQHACSLVLVTHPKKGKKGGVGLDDLAGGAAYQRFSQTILWIERVKKTVTIKASIGRCDMTVNRTIKIAKARNGKGTGLELAYKFNGGNLLFAEQGIIVEE